MTPRWFLGLAAQAFVLERFQRHLFRPGLEDPGPGSPGLRLEALSALPAISLWPRTRKGLVLRLALEWQRAKRAFSIRYEGYLYRSIAQNELLTRVMHDQKG